MLSSPIDWIARYLKKFDLALPFYVKFVEPSQNYYFNEVAHRNPIVLDRTTGV